MDKSPDLQRWLVFGASGNLGRCLLARLLADRNEVHAVSRRPMGAAHGVHWHCTSLESAPEPATLVGALPTVIACCGPLDAFSQWLATHPPAPGTRVLALSSLSAEWKAQSPQPQERALAERLRDSEARLLEVCADRAAIATVFRCGLIYGGGECRSLAPLLRLARRLRVLPWPRRARGLREPVHADDIARALIASVAGDEFAQSVLCLPGPQRIGFDLMLQCSLELLAPPPRLLRLPMPGLRTLSSRLALHHGRLGGLAGAVLRLHLDQCGSASDWSRLGVEPRPFAAREAVMMANFSTDGDRKSA